MPFDLPVNPFLAPKALDKDPSKLGSLVGEEGRRLMRDLLEEGIDISLDDSIPEGGFALSEDERAEEEAISESRTYENRRLLQEAREILGERNVHAAKDIEFALGYPIDRSKIPSISYTVEDFLKSKELKERVGVEEMLILCVADKDGKPLTMKRMREIFNQRYKEMGLGECFKEERYDLDQPFYEDSGLVYEWKLITKECIPGSTNKPHDWRPGDFWMKDQTQERAIKAYGEKMDIPSVTLHRPEPCEMMYAIVVHFLNTEHAQEGKGELILQKVYHRTGSMYSDGGCVCIHANADRLWAGIRTAKYERYQAYDFIGTCLSRSPLRSLPAQHDSDRL